MNEVVNTSKADLLDNLEFNPTDVLKTFSLKELKSFIKRNQKAGHYTIQEDPDIALEFTQSQQEVLNYVENFLTLPLKSVTKAPLRFILTGIAGSGKTVTIKKIRQQFEKAGRKVRLCSPFGSIAKSIGGKTCHSLFSIPYKGGSYETLSEKLKCTPTLTQTFLGVDLIIIDESYNLSPAFLHYISLVLSKALDNKNPFGGISIILAGDLLQLAPVASYALWTSPEKLDSFSKKGSDLYRAFTKVFFLRESLRTKDKEFEKILLHVRQKEVTEEDLNKLRSRRESVLSPEERSRFKGCPRIYPRNAFSRDYNKIRINQLEKPVVTLKPQQQPAFPVVIEPEDFVPICLQAEVRLKKNLDVDAGLSTGSIGTVEGIIFDTEKPCSLLPAIILVRFLNVTGATIDGLTPVPASTEYFSDPRTSRSFKVTSFPLQLNYSFSVHVSQGASIPLVAIYLDSRELSVNSTYVSLSRATELKNIMILDTEIPSIRFNAANFFTGFTDIKAEYERLGISKFLLNPDPEDEEPVPKKYRIDLKI